MNVEIIILPYICYINISLNIIQRKRERYKVYNIEYVRKIVEASKFFLIIMENAIM